MVKGLLLVDQKMNTVIVPFNDDSLSEFFRFNRRQLETAVSHSTKESLLKDVRAYINGTYIEGGHNEEEDC